MSNEGEPLVSYLASLADRGGPAQPALPVRMPAALAHLGWTQRDWNQASYHQRAQLAAELSGGPPPLSPPSRARAPHGLPTGRREPLGSQTAIHRAWEGDSGNTLSVYDFNNFREQGMSEQEVRAWAERHSLQMPREVPADPAYHQAPGADAGGVDSARARYDRQAAALRHVGHSVSEITRQLGPRPR
jgi:hypothetical protein